MALDPRSAHPAPKDRRRDRVDDCVNRGERIGKQHKCQKYDHSNAQSATQPHSTPDTRSFVCPAHPSQLNPFDLRLTHFARAGLAAINAMMKNDTARFTDRLAAT